MFYYPFDPRIHNLGNTGIKGAIHAEFAPVFTKLIDLKAYNGRDIRKEITQKLLDENKQNNKNYSVLDLCCGVGLSTAEFGIDTSQQMINKAKRLFPNKKFIVANAECFGNINESNESNEVYNFNVVTSMFSFHEMPMTAHEKIIENSMKLAKKEILIIDLSPEYISSQLMRNGEPYLLDYQKTIEKTMDKYSFKRTDYIPNHVTIWKYTI